MDDAKPALPLRRSARRSSASARPWLSILSPASTDERLPAKKRARPTVHGPKTTVKTEHVSDATTIGSQPPPAKQKRSSGQTASMHQVKEDARAVEEEMSVNVDGAWGKGQTTLAEASYSTVVRAQRDTNLYEHTPNAGSSGQPVPVGKMRVIPAVDGKSGERHRGGKGKRRFKIEDEEKRPARYRERCPQNTRDRVGRVMSQRMYLVDREKVPSVPNMETFKVLGSTGNVYSIVIGPNPTCNCPDCMKGNVPCKHIIFVFLKVLKVPEHSDLWYQKGLLTAELAQIFAASPEAVAGASAPDHVRNAYLKATGSTQEAEGESKEAGGTDSESNRKLDSLGEDCPVCYEEMSETDDKKGKLVYDEVPGGCGKPLHKDCFKMWAQTARNKGDAVTCVWCRSPWPDNGAGASGKGKGPQYTETGYLNMAAEAGMSRQRDTSTYYYGPRAGQRLWTAHYRYMDDY